MWGETMDRTLLGMATTIYSDVDEKTPTDSIILNTIKTFVNRGYKEIAKREKEKQIKVTAIDGKFAKPLHYKQGIQLIYGNTPIDFDEDDTYITCDYSGDMEFIYEYDYEGLDDLIDTTEPFTNKENDEAILSYAKMLYWKKEGKYDKSEVEKRDYETFYIKRPKKIVTVKTLR
jgi:hypothetical protein